MHRDLSILAIVLAVIVTVTPLAFAQQLQVRLVNVTSPVAPGKDATLAVQTTPKAACKITVQYASGPITTKGLGPKTADVKGNVRWTWRVGPKTKTGVWPVIVSCSLKKQLAKLETSIAVQK